MPKPTLHFGDISEHWQKQSLSATAASIKIFSPYITGRQTLQLASRHPSAEVYTVFDAELFVAGASSLHELRALIEAEVAVYHLPDLHAKIVWIPDSFLSVGSQNLTNRGRQNREATVAIDHDPWMSDVEKELQLWLANRLAISIEMIDDMAEAVDPLLEDSRRRRAAHDETNKAIIAADAIRREAERQRLETEQRRLAVEQRNRLFATSFRSLTSSRLMIATISDSGRRLPGESLIAPPGRSFLRWDIDGEAANLERFNRYLCVVPELSRFGWARITQGFITFIEREIHRDYVRFLDAHCAVVMKAIDPTEGVAFNMILEIKRHPVLGTASLRLWVDAGGVDLVEVTGVDTPEARGGIQQRWTEMRLEVVRLMTNRFKYSANLTGENAGKFFYGEPGSEFKVQLAKWGDQPVLIAEAVTRE